MCHTEALVLLWCPSRLVLPLGEAEHQAWCKGMVWTAGGLASPFWGPADGIALPPRYLWTVLHKYLCFSFLTCIAGLGLWCRGF